MDNFSFLNAAHTAFFADLYDQYLKDPDIKIIEFEHKITTWW